MLGYHLVTPTFPVLAVARERDWLSEDWSRKMKFVIVEQGGKQYRAAEGETIEVDRLPNEVGETVTLEDVLLSVNDDEVTIGTPLIEGAKVQTKVLDHFKGRKILVFKYRPKQRYRVKSGHRQQYTRLLIESIEME
jgi:large subunit ribosomal protein L21